jgi:ferredoxin
LKDKKVKMIDVLPACMSCGDCVAICPRGAIQLKGYFQLKRYFRYLDRGEPLLPRKF